MARLNAVATAGAAQAPLERLVERYRAKKLLSSSGPQTNTAAAAIRDCSHRWRSYATTTSSVRSPTPQQQEARTGTKPLTIPFASTSHHAGQSLQPPTLAYIQSHLPAPQSPQTRELRVGTVTRAGSMPKTVQITYNTQWVDKWHQTLRQRSVRILAHEPTGYLREGDVVQFAHFTPATMAERYERGLLDGRRGGVRYEVHRVVTPFGEPVQERSELGGRGELYERLASVEFGRRREDLRRPWNRFGERRVRILENMEELLWTELQSIKQLLTLGSDAVVDQVEAGEQQPAADSTQQQQIPASDKTERGQVDAQEEVTDAEKDIAAQLQKLQPRSPSVRAEE